LYTRLKRLGYVEDDAAKLTRDCMTRNGIKIDKERQAALAKEIRQQRQAEATARRLAKEFEAAVEKDARNRAKAQKVREDRMKLLIKLSEDYATKVGILLPDAVIGLQQIINRAISTGLAPINVIYQGAATLAADPTVMDYESFSRELAALLVNV
jgi:hypothetical protein